MTNFFIYCKRIQNVLIIPKIRGKFQAKAVLYLKCTWISISIQIKNYEEFKKSLTHSVRDPSNFLFSLGYFVNYPWNEWVTEMKKFLELKMYTTTKCCPITILSTFRREYLPVFQLLSTSFNDNTNKRIYLNWVNPSSRSSTGNWMVHKIEIFSIGNFTPLWLLYRFYHYIY